jgi:hypothetical protein
VSRRDLIRRAVAASRPAGLRAVAAAIVAGIGVATLALPAAAASPPADAPALAALLDAKGLGCHSFTPDQGVPNVSSGTCDVIGHEANVEIAVYPTAAKLKHDLPSLTRGICKTLQAAKVHRRIYVSVGPNWLAIFEDKYSAGRVRAVLKAKTRTLSC